MKKFTTLVATDFSKSSYVVLAKALDFTHAMGGELHVIHVTENSMFSFKKDMETIRQNSYAKLLEDFPTIPEDKFYCVSGRVKTEVAKIASVVGADMIIIGKSGETYFLDELVLGSHTKDIVRNSDIPVLVIKNVQEIEYKTILVPSDLSSASAKTIETLATLFPQSKLRILNFYYLPFESRLNTYGFDEAEVIEYQAKVREESEINLHKFVSGLNLPSTADIATSVRRSSLNAELFNQEVEDIDFDLLAMHTTGSVSFYAFDLLETSKKDVILLKKSH
ncbi:MAG: universal stress protein [Sulfurimonadaceae bacterium]|jgi:nucleotide-binding universal stress UspA family protein|nr:universal stress protein [Sulfurimonadaceae bacterium]